MLSNFLAAAIPGDYNGNVSVDAADYVVWRNTGSSQSGYDTWRANFGQTAGSGAALSSAAALSPVVPEPNAFFLLISALTAPIATRRKRRIQKGGDWIA